MNNLYLAHHGILGQKWGIRRYQNPDGSLTEAGKKRYFNNDGSLTEAGKKHTKEITKKLWTKNNNDYKNRNEIFKKIEKELSETKEGKDLENLVKKRGIRNKNGEITLSYLKDDWSNPEKVLNELAKDLKIQEAYKSKTSEIGRKYANELRGAALKDLGYKDTEAGREWLASLHVLDPR